MECLLGLDIGTSGTKVALFEVGGGLLAAHTAEYPLYQPRPGWAEQDPADWWQATCSGIRQVLSAAGVKPTAIKAIGLSGQMHGAVLLDAHGEVIRPAIIWCDQRSVAEAEAIADDLGQAKVIELTGNPALPNFTATKLLWVRRHEPENYRKIAKVLLPKDYIRYKLTGEFATEVSDASGTLLFDVAGRKWSDEMLDCLAINREWLPECTESAVVSGRVTPAAAGETGLACGTPVVGGAGDQAAGAVGNGIVEQGLVSATIGTSGVVFAATTRMVTDPLGRLHSFCHAVDGLWHVMGVTQAAGGSLQWFRHTLAPDVSYDLLTEEAAEVPPGAEGLIFLPYLMGERTPHLDPFARGVFFGLSSRHDRRHLTRAVLEGVTFSLRDCLDLIIELGVDFDQVRASGGGARSRLWRQIMADVFNQPVVSVAASEGPAFGVAILAGVGIGLYPSVGAACRQCLQVSDPVVPQRETSRFYQMRYQLFRQLYQALKDCFTQNMQRSDEQ